MNRIEFESLKDAEGLDTRIWAKDFPEGTLLYGYTRERETFHIYKMGSQIHRLVCHKGEPPGCIIDHQHGEHLPADILSPDKRVYPGRTRLDFVLALKKKDVPVIFTNFNDDEPQVEVGQFVGLVVEPGDGW
jgi:hypothetical protein